MSASITDDSRGQKHTEQQPLQKHRLLCRTQTPEISRATKHKKKKTISWCFQRIEFVFIHHMHRGRRRGLFSVQGGKKDKVYLLCLWPFLVCGLIAPVSCGWECGTCHYTSGIHNKGRQCVHRLDWSVTLTELNERSLELRQRRPLTLQPLVVLWPLNTRFTTT